MIALALLLKIVLALVAAVLLSAWFFSRLFSLCCRGDEEREAAYQDDGSPDLAAALHERN